MTPRHTKFYRDKRNGRWMGVCAGIADYTGIDVTIIRIATAVLTIMASGTIFFAYLAVGFIAPIKPRSLAYEDQDEARFWQGVRASPARTVRDVRSKFRDIDRRLADIETYVTSSDAQLSREIERLR